MRPRPLIRLLLALFLGAAAAAGGELSGTVVRVIDGDTIEVEVAGETVRVRVAGVDAPERGQPFYRAAGELTATLTLGRAVIVHTRGIDEDGRAVGRVLVDDLDLGVTLLASGRAWHLEEDNDPDLAAAERKARDGKIGIWSDPNPVAPWEYRAEKGSDEQK